MASPFTVFRKHQKWLIAVLGMLAIIAFAVGDQLMQLMSGGGGGARQNPLIVSTSYGDVHEYEMQRMLQVRRNTQGFLNTLFQLGIQAGGIPQAYPLIPPDSPASEQVVIETMLLAHRAEELGIVVTDGVINHYLKQLTGNAVTAERMRQVAAGFAVNQTRMTMPPLFDAIRQEMLAAKVRESFQLSTGVTPAQQWEYYLQLNDRVTAEVSPIKVADFIAKVDDPSDAELEAFFDKYKDRVKYRMIVGGVQMDAAEPGFKSPRRMAFQYVQSDYDAAVDRVADSITDEEVAKYYEDNKRLFIKATLLPGEDPLDKPEEGVAPEPPAPPTPDKAGEDGDPKDGDAAEGAEKPATTPEKDTAEESTAPEPAGTPKETEAPEEGETEPAADSSSLSLDARTQFVALQDDPETPPATAQDEPATEPKATEADDTAPKAADPKEVSPKDPETEPAPGTTEPKEAGPADADPPEKEPEYQPLSEVEDTIRQRLANQRAAVERDKVLEPIREAMKDYNYVRTELLIRYAQPGEVKEDEIPPVPPEVRKRDAEEVAKIAKLAEEAGLQVKQTKLISFNEIDDIPIGKSTAVDDGIDYSRFAFSGLARDFKPTLTSADGASYMVWKIDDQAERTPTLDEIRPEVVREWKMIKARDLAKADAERLAKEAQASKQSLTEFFADQKQHPVTTTEPFSWRTQGTVPDNPRNTQVRLSEVDGVVDAGPEFMETVFDKLKTGEVGVAPNHSETTMYIVRIDAHAATDEALRENFLAAPGPWTQLAVQANQRAVYTALAEDLKSWAHVEWQRPPDTFEQ